MSRLYANENFPLPTVIALRKRGHDVLTTQDTGMAGSTLSDEEVLNFAKRDDRIVVTINRRHFIGLHLQNPHHPGIIVCSFHPDFQMLAQKVHEALQKDAILSEKLIRINREPS